MAVTEIREALRSKLLESMLGLLRGTVGGQ